MMKIIEYKIKWFNQTMNYHVKVKWLKEAVPHLQEEAYIWDIVEDNPLHHI